LYRESDDLCPEFGGKVEEAAVSRGLCFRQRCLLERH
jgi:hypothetical protein